MRYDLHRRTVAYMSAPMKFGSHGAPLGADPRPEDFGEDRIGVPDPSNGDRGMEGLPPPQPLTHPGLPFKNLRGGK